ncbi:uncharacterized protein BDR25DRAFT_363436 [Lindgomyces ingoldianus]
MLSIANSHLESNGLLTLFNALDSEIQLQVFLNLAEEYRSEIAQDNEDLIDRLEGYCPSIDNYEDNVVFVGQLNTFTLGRCQRCVARVSRDIIPMYCTIHSLGIAPVSYSI